MVEWRNTRGQLSWVRAAIKGCPEFSVAQFPLACIPQGLVEELKINLTAEDALTWWVWFLDITHIHTHKHTSFNKLSSALS